MALAGFIIPTFTTTKYLKQAHFSVESVRLAASAIDGVEYHAPPNAFVVTKDTPDLEAYMHSLIWKWQFNRLRCIGGNRVRMSQEATDMLTSIEDYLIIGDGVVDRRYLAATDLIKRLNPIQYSTDAELLASLSDRQSYKIGVEMNEIDCRGMLTKCVHLAFDDDFTEYPPRRN